LQFEVERRTEPAETHIVHLKSIELMTVNGDMAQSLVLPGIVLINADANQMRHDVGETVIVIALDPDDFDVALGIRQLANVAEKPPVLLGEAGKVEISKNVAQQDQPLKAIFLQHLRCFARAAGGCTEMQVGEDQRVVHGQIHILFVAGECYEAVNIASKLVHVATKVTWITLWYTAVSPRLVQRELFQSCEYAASHVD
jgi:hypothetical protein